LFLFAHFLFEFLLLYRKALHFFDTLLRNLHLVFKHLLVACQHKLIFFFEKLVYFIFSLNSRLTHLFIKSLKLLFLLHVVSNPIYSFFKSIISLVLKDSQSLIYELCFFCYVNPQSHHGYFLYCFVLNLCCKDVFPQVFYCFHLIYFFSSN
jgi:hypothetical protein